MGMPGWCFLAKSPTINCVKFKAEIENYMKNRPDNPDIKFYDTFCSLNFRTWSCRSNITKKEGYSAHYLLFILGKEK